MEKKNGVQNILMSNGIMFKIEENQAGLPEIISEETFCDILKLQSQDETDNLPTDIYDEGFENDDLEDDGLYFV